MRTNIEIDEKLIEGAMRISVLKKKSSCGSWAEINHHIKTPREDQKPPG